MKFKTLSSLFLISVLMMSGCRKAPSFIPLTTEPAQPARVEDKTSFVAALQISNATAEIVDSVIQDFFSPEGSIVKVNGQDVQVFEYENKEAMESDASQVAPEGGSIGTSMVTWMDVPHFYKAGRIIVLYVGSDKATLDLLEKVMGPQFAGR